MRHIVIALLTLLSNEDIVIALSTPNAAIKQSNGIGGGADGAVNLLLFDNEDVGGFAKWLVCGRNDTSQATPSKIQYTQ